MKLGTFDRVLHAGAANAGFSLLELTAAIFVLTVGMFGAVQMYHVGVSKAGAVREAATAATAIDNELETLRATPFEALENGEHGQFVSETPALNSLFKAQPKVLIADYDAEHPDLKRVTVSVRWVGEHGRGIEKGVTTLIADKGRQ